MTNAISITTMHSWPFLESKKILEEEKNTISEKGYILFATGYGPSGLPHIGTFGEVVRTAAVIKALKEMDPSIKTKLFVYSDDMDGLRKIPNNIPNSHLLEEFIGCPLTSVPDPFEKFPSYGEYMNDRLNKFLSNYDFEYEFKSATKCYKEGQYNETIQKILSKHDAISNIVKNHIGEERQKTYSPILPISKKTNKILLTKIEDINLNESTITYKNEKGELEESSVLNGCCKMQWRVDWAMRWSSFDINYEMHGKDLDSSADIAKQICTLISNDGRTPILFRYELFLDKDGKKISKSKGNGLSVEEWLQYAPKETLSLYMYYRPSRAKRLHIDVVPKTVDEYLSYNKKYWQNPEVDNPMHVIHSQSPPNLSNININFSLLTNLASAINAQTHKDLENFLPLQNFNNKEEEEFYKKIIEGAVKFNLDMTSLTKKDFFPSEKESIDLKMLSNKLTNKENADEEEIQKLIYETGKELNYSISEWFKLIYKTLIGQDHGPKLGSFIKIYGVKKTKELLDKKTQ